MYYFLYLFLCSVIVIEEKVLAVENGPFFGFICQLTPVTAFNFC